MSTGVGIQEFLTSVNIRYLCKESRLVVYSEETALRSQFLQWKETFLVRGDKAGSANQHLQHLFYFYTFVFVQIQQTRYTISEL